MKSVENAAAVFVGVGGKPGGLRRARIPESSRRFGHSFARVSVGEAIVIVMSLPIMHAAFRKQSEMSDPFPVGLGGARRVALLLNPVAGGKHTGPIGLQPGGIVRVAIVRPQHPQADSGLAHPPWRVGSDKAPVRRCHLAVRSDVLVAILPDARLMLGEPPQAGFGVFVEAEGIQRNRHLDELARPNPAGIPGTVLRQQPGNVRLLGHILQARQDQVLVDIVQSRFGSAQLHAGLQRLIPAGFGLLERLLKVLGGHATAFRLRIELGTAGHDEVKIAGLSRFKLQLEAKPVVDADRFLRLPLHDLQLRLKRNRRRSARPIGQQHLSVDHERSLHVGDLHLLLLPTRRGRTESGVA